MIKRTVRIFFLPIWLWLQCLYYLDGSIMSALRMKRVSPSSENLGPNGHYPGSLFNGTNEKPPELLSSHMQRRHSTPLMPAFMVSAPGKVIVFGEHAVVHGKVFSSSITWKFISFEHILAGDSCCHSPSIIPTCHGPFEVQTNRFIEVSWYIARAYLEHRWLTMVDFLTSIKEKILLRSCNQFRRRSYRCYPASR